MTPAHSGKWAEAVPAHKRPTTYTRSVRLSEDLRDQMAELATEHNRNFADEIRHALTVYVAFHHRQRQIGK